MPWDRRGGDDSYRRTYPNGRVATVTRYSSGWDVSIRYPDGNSHRGDRYYSSKAAAMKAADRLAAAGSVRRGDSISDWLEGRA